MAVELCKVSLWMEALEPGRPLSFLDAHIKCGNSLLGTTVALMDRGIPDDAYKTITSDVSAVASEWKRQNRTEREGQREHRVVGPPHQHLAGWAALKERPTLLPPGR